MSGRVFTKKEYDKRKKLATKTSDLADDLNDAIGKAFKLGYAPDVSVDIRYLINRPVIKVNFFRDDDAIQN